MSTKQPIERVADAASSAAEATADRAARGLDASRQMANQVFDTLDAKVQNLHDDVPPAVDALAQRVQELARQTEALALRAHGQVRQRIGAAADRATAHVVEKPLQSMALAAAAGALLALVLGRRRR